MVGSVMLKTNTTSRRSSAATWLKSVCAHAKTGRGPSPGLPCHAAILPVHVLEIVKPSATPFSGLVALGRKQEGDAQFIEVIELNDRAPIAERAKEERSKLAGVTFRARSGGVERLDAVSYCLAALKRFEGMAHKEIQKIG